MACRHLLDNFFCNAGCSTICLPLTFPNQENRGIPKGSYYISITLYWIWFLNPGSWDVLSSQELLQLYPTEIIISEESKTSVGSFHINNIFWKIVLCKTSQSMHFLNTLSNYFLLKMTLFQEIQLLCILRICQKSFQLMLIYFAINITWNIKFSLRQSFQFFL